MKISIITVCRNAAHLLDAAIRSVAAQTYADLEYVILDGQSEDGTAAVVAPYLEQGVVHQFISEPDAGVYDAMNKALALAQGDYLYFLNADDALLDGAVMQDMAVFLMEHPDCDLLYGRVDVVGQRGKGQTTVTYPDPPNLLEHLAFGWICHQAMVVRTELFRQIGGFDTRFALAADYDWLLRAIAHSAKLYALPRTFATYRLGGLSDSAQVQSLTEMFEVQNQFAPYQESDWVGRRLRRLQATMLERTAQDQQRQARLHAQRQKLDALREELQATQAELNETRDRLQGVEAELDALKNRTLGNVRWFWFHSKQWLRRLKNRRSSF